LVSFSGSLIPSCWKRH